MPTENFECSECDYRGKISYRNIETRFEASICFCPFCGSDLETEVTEELDFED